MRHILLLIGLIAIPVRAADVIAVVSNSQGEAVEQAVIYALPLAETLLPAAAQQAVIDQIDKEFVPALTVVYKGAQISFPNNDNIRHHVYSFSRSNPFEIPLYAGQTAPPVTFANPGVVALGCNVHDWMSAYVFVSDTPFYAVTGSDGVARIQGLPPGDYAVEVWHASLRGKPAKTRQEVRVEGDALELSFSIRQKKVWKAWRDDAAEEEGY